MFRYIGNKTRLLPFIIEKTKEIIGPTGIVADIMAGTGSVSLGYRKNGYKVIASDVMTYSYHHLVSQLQLDAAPEFELLYEIELQKHRRYESLLSYLNDLSPEEGYFFNEFSPEGTPANGSDPRKYFTSSNAKKIDSVRKTINYLKFSNQITSVEESVLKHTLIMAVNRVANISGTYGHYLSDFTTSSLKPIQLTSFIFERGRTDNVVLQGFAEEVSSDISADLCYIDPPYMKRQYAANYHILETIARGDCPEAIGQSGLRNWWDQHSKFCTKTRSEDSFKKIITSMDCDNFLISYSEDGLLSIDKLQDLFSKHGDVRATAIPHSRYRSNKSKLPPKINEYILELHRAR